MLPLNVIAAGLTSLSTPVTSSAVDTEGAGIELSSVVEEMAEDALTGGSCVEHKITLDARDCAILSAR